MTNWVQDGDVITLTAPYAVLSGGGALVGSIFGVATADVANGAQGEFITEGVVTIAKTSAQAWATVGLLIYWDDATKLATTTVATNKLIGTNLATAVNPSGTCAVRLNGSFNS